MPRGHARGQHRGRHLLEPTRSASFQTVFRRRRLALVTAPLATALVVGTGVATSGFSSVTAPGATGTASASLGAQTTGLARTDPTVGEERELGTTRSTDRAPLVSHRVAKPTGKLWTTANLDVRTQPREKTRTVGLLDAGKRVPVTGRRIAGYAEVLVGKVPRWVTADYLSKKKAPAERGLSGAPCPDGSSIEAGLQPAAVKVYRAACAAFPELTTYGGQDGHGEHVNGQAIDFMVTDGGTGQRLADFLYAKRAELDLFDIIWAQRIWTIQRSSEGFRPMSDRGSATANHYDHVHIKVN